MDKQNGDTILKTLQNSLDNENKNTENESCKISESDKKSTNDVKQSSEEIKSNGDKDGIVCHKEAEPFEKDCTNLEEDLLQSKTKVKATNRRATSDSICDSNTSDVDESSHLETNSAADKTKCDKYKLAEAENHNCDKDKISKESKEITDLESDPKKQTECDKVNISAEKNASTNLNANSKEGNSTSCDSKKIKDLETITESHAATERTHSQNNNNNSENYKEAQQSDNITKCELNIKSQNAITDCTASKERDKLDSLSSSAGELVGPLITLNDDATKEQNENQDKHKNVDNEDTTSAINEDSEGEFEDVEIPEEVDELIVPDEGEELTNLDEDDDDNCTKVPSQNTKNNDVKAEEDETSNSKSPEDEESNHGHIESELIAIGEPVKDNSSDDDQTINDAESNSCNAANDPLNCLDASQQSGEDTNQTLTALPENAINSDEYQEDDDDVEFIETRNSPICIESDEEDSKETATTATSMDTQTINLPTATITLPKTLTITRTSARKSTARPQSASPSPHTLPQKDKSKRFSYLDKATTYIGRRSLPSNLTIITQQVVDTIEVLDSSDEESSPANSRASTAQNLKTPPKRTLMAAKCPNNNKNANKPAFPKKSGMSSNFTAQIKQQQRKPAPPPLPPATPQSNFLNNVQLQPATSGSNPPTFSALLSNKSVIIPNAFYGNHPSVRGHPTEVDMERRYVRWLENFIAQFCNPQLVASHSCFVLLQRALKYKDFVRIKAIRTNLNVNAQKATDQVNHQLSSDLRTIFLKSSKEITPHGRRFCEMACSTPQNKMVTLLIHASTGRIIMKSCNMETPIVSASSSSTSSNNSSTATRKRQLDEDEYVPVKNKFKSSRDSNASENVEEDDECRKRSLRSKRAKRIDESFSYNEDDLAEYDLDDEEEAERAAQAEIQRKIDQKRLEAQRQRQQQAKSFESAFIQAFAKSIDGKELNRSKQTEGNNNNRAAQRARVNHSASSPNVHQHLVNNDAEDLLAATWIENVENEDTQIISDDEEPKQHRIYKQMQQEKQYKQQKQLHRPLPPNLASKTRNENNMFQQLHLDSRQWPKNTDLHLHSISKNKDICVICKLNVQRVVHHYVNEHRGCEVYNSRLTSSQVEHLRRGASNIFNVTLYKNGQPQYEAHCIFCQKLSKFMLPYWIQHFTMHTGEYAYRCSGCGIRKPTRSLLTQHHSQGCPQNGSVLQDYTHDTKKVRVEARICTLCNFVQLHRSNIVKHLHLQHQVKQILPKHIQTIVLLKLDASTESTVPPAAWTPQQKEKSPTTRRQKTSFAASATVTDNTYVIDDDDDDDDVEEANDDDTLLFGDTIQSIPQHQHQQIDDNAQNYSYNYIPPYMRNASQNNNIVWEQNDTSEDISYMICGMLDVEMNNAE